MKIVMILEPLTTLTRKLSGETWKQKKIDDDFMSANGDFVVIFFIYFKFGTIRKTVSDLCSLKRICLLTITFFLTKTESRNKKSLMYFSYYCFE